MHWSSWWYLPYQAEYPPTRKSERLRTGYLKAYEYVLENCCFEFRQDLQQADLTSLASGESYFLGREAADRATKSKFVSRQY